MGSTFSAATCFRQLQLPAERFASLTQLATRLAESVAAGLASPSEGSGESFEAAQKRLLSSVAAAAARMAGTGAASSSSALDPMALRALFPNSYQVS